MAGYWDNAVLSFFDKAVDIEEDWDDENLSFVLCNPTGRVTLQFGQCKLEDLRRVFGENIMITLECDLDLRYVEGDGPGVKVTVRLADVEFPERPA